MMNSEIRGLKRAEAATYQLRGLYEDYGYRKYRMGKFEEYSLYAANKSFLLSENVLTFTDLDGRLMALKPDITLGIAKNTRDGRESCEKVYYIENVYRESKESHTYKEISQMGLECMGGVDDCVVAEVVALAVQSLAAFETEYVLKISNMDFIVGMMERLTISEETKSLVLSLMRKKNRSELERLCRGVSFPEREGELVLRAAALCGPFAETLDEAEELAQGPVMKHAVQRLRRLYEVLENMGLANRVRLDFSMINNTEYYNGIIFQGYLDGLARQVLSGGQYDGMMARLGKQADAIGFAIYLKELDRLPEKRAPYDADALILYDADAAPGRVLREAQKLRDTGLRVRIEKTVPPDLRVRKLYRFGAEGLLDVTDEREEGVSC